ncbi:MAG: hypothetical protein JSS82_00065 [Bacteroidetes bacterium]|nr:hypothetical protein [Bacteroidota bacterium]
MDKTKQKRKRRPTEPRPEQKDPEQSSSSVPIEIKTEKEDDVLTCEDTSDLIVVDVEHPTRRASVLPNLGLTTLVRPSEDILSKTDAKKIGLHVVLPHTRRCFTLMTTDTRYDACYQYYNRHAKGCQTGASPSYHSMMIETDKKTGNWLVPSWVLEVSYKTFKDVGLDTPANYTPEGLKIFLVTICVQLECGSDSFPAINRIYLVPSDMSLDDFMKKHTPHCRILTYANLNWGRLKEGIVVGEDRAVETYQENHRCIDDFIPGKKRLLEFPNDSTTKLVKTTS